MRRIHMMKAPLLALLLLAPGLAVAQDENIPQPSEQSLKYRELRHRSTEPIHSVAKIKALIKTLKADENENRALPPAKFNALTVEERFSYTLLHGEDYSQNCDAMMPIVDEHKKVFAYYPGPFSDEAVWSDQQRKFLAANRSRVIALTRQTISVRKSIGVNLKQVITTVRANELIPLVIATYRRDRKDHDLLTVLMLLMHEGKYKPFLETDVCKTLYAEDAFYGSHLGLTQKLVDQVLGLATAFHKSRTK